MKAIVLTRIFGHLDFDFSKGFAQRHILGQCGLPEFGVRSGSSIHFALIHHLCKIALLHHERHTFSRRSKNGDRPRLGHPQHRFDDTRIFLVVILTRQTGNRRDDRISTFVGQLSDTVLFHQAFFEHPAIQQPVPMNVNLGSLSIVDHLGPVVGRQIVIAFLCIVPRRVI